MNLRQISVRQSTKMHQTAQQNIEAKRHYRNLRDVANGFATTASRQLGYMSSTPCSATVGMLPGGCTRVG